MIVCRSSISVYRGSSLQNFSVYCTPSDMPASSSKQAAASAASKPYDRPSKGSTKGKGKAAAAPSTTSAGVNIGAPATHGQSSRKGKKAWRKNVDITAEETALEQGREEERITG